jgi:hypothetical protein
LYALHGAFTGTYQWAIAKMTYAEGKLIWSKTLRLNKMESVYPTLSTKSFSSIARDPFDLTSFSIHEMVTNSYGFYEPYIASFTDNGIELNYKYQRYFRSSTNNPSINGPIKYLPNRRAVAIGGRMLSP